jgi:hypothetical protein
MGHALLEARILLPRFFPARVEGTEMASADLGV